MERPVSLGGTKQWDLRKVTLHSRQEEATFRENVEAHDWIETPVSHDPYGAHGVLLSDLVEEHHRAMHAALEEELRNPAPAEVEDENPEADVAAEANTERQLGTGGMLCHTKQSAANAWFQPLNWITYMRKPGRNRCRQNLSGDPTRPHPRASSPHPGPLHEPTQTTSQVWRVETKRLRRFRGYPGISDSPAARLGRL